MRPALILLAGLLAGCAQIVGNDIIEGGLARAEPHATAPGAYRVVWIVAPDFTPLGPVNINSPAGRQAFLPRLLGNDCSRGRIQEEGSLPYAPDMIGNTRRLLVTRVDCA